MPPVIREYPPGTFGHYLGHHGIPSLKALPPTLHSLGRRLSERPQKIAPNSPMLPRMAEALGVPLAEVQAFAKGPPMKAKFVEKIRSQLANGTLPQGPAHSRVMKRHARAKKRAKAREGVVLGEVTVERRARRGPAPSLFKPGGGGATPKKGSFLAFVQKHSEYETLIDLAKAAKIRNGIVWLLNTSGKVAKDSPALDRLATTLGVPVGAVARFARGGHTKQTGYGKRAERNLAVEDHRASGKALVHVPAAETNGNGKATPAKYNRLKKQAVELRQAARDLVTSLNITIMQGEPLTPPLPTTVLHAILQDYLGEKGLKGNVLVDPRFAEFFDRS